MRELVGQHGFELHRAEPPQQAARDHDHGIPQRASRREGVRHVRTGERESRFGEIGHRRKAPYKRPQLRLLTVRELGCVGRGKRDPLREGREVADSDSDHREGSNCEQPGVGQAQNDHDEGDRQREVQESEQHECRAHAQSQPEIAAGAAFHALRCRP